jgi:hypothetical protein
MEKITSVTKLKESIRLLEIQQAKEEELLKIQVKITFESLKPANLIKKTLSEWTTVPDLKSDLLNTTISLAAGFLSKKAAIGFTHNPIKQLFGTLLQIGVTRAVSKNTDKIKWAATYILNNILNKKETS